MSDQFVAVKQVKFVGCFHSYGDLELPVHVLGLPLHEPKNLVEFAGDHRYAIMDPSMPKAASPFMV